MSPPSMGSTHQVFKAMRLQIFLYDTFRRHARMFMEPAIVHTWRESQEVMLQQLSQDKVILGGDMRADSPGTPAFYNLEKELTKKTVLKDIAKLSPHYQTSSLEAFHSVILRFAPKNVVYPYLGMLCRLYLAALHYNENADGGQATTSSGDPRFKLSFPKSRKGECRARPVKTEATFRFVDDLIDMIMEKVFVDPSSYRDEILKINIPPDPSSQYEHPDKEEVIASYVSRFNYGGGEFEASISSPGVRKLRRTTHEGITTRIFRPRKPQHQLTKLL
ncbi:uncharacterized protein LOC120551100 [Perca fluviatilis]|uniref:uncharacterized protein LOC120551100 n=1 Tax=Perca fluviatilis TaxID=8168 RepID=UPI0019652110|nr:uncharacterized protein LOC120551100 [Perca fluviatilis]